jgi:acetyl esterase/lipase
MMHAFWSLARVRQGALLAAVASLAAARPAAAQRYEVETLRDVEYGKGGGETLKLDLARPKGAKGPRPVIIYIHGGGWAQGDRSHHLGAAQHAARAGYVGVTVGYRLAPKHIWPAQIEDCKCAIRYLRAHASQHGLDPNRIAAIGFSAGAHLAMLLGSMDPADGLEGDGGWSDQSSKVQVVASYFGPTDLTADYPPASVNIVRRFLGGTKAEKPKEYRQASPVTYVTPGDAPMLLFQGTKDRLVPYQQAFTMAEALTRAGVPGRVEVLLGEDHGWRGQEVNRTTAAYLAFFEQHLATKERPRE